MIYTKNDIEKEIESDDILGSVNATVKNSSLLSDTDCVAMVNQTGVTLTQYEQEFYISGSWKAINRAYKLLMDIKAGKVLKQKPSQMDQQVKNIDKEDINSSTIFVKCEDQVLDLPVAAEIQVSIKSPQEEDIDNPLGSDINSPGENPGMVTGMELGEDEREDPGVVDDEKAMEDHDETEVNNQRINANLGDSDDVRSTDKDDVSGGVQVSNDKTYMTKVKLYRTRSDVRTERDDNVDNHVDQGNSFMCHVCGKSFTRKRYLSRHVMRHEETSKKFKCQICGWKFFERQKLRLHLETHKPSDQQSLPYKCSLCDRQFHNRAGWSDHMNGHAGKRPWKCDVCEAAFTYRGALKRHQNVHREKQYKCKTCSKEFAHKETLDSHMSIHTGVTSHICPCGKAYTVGASLKRHQEKCKERDSTTGRGAATAAHTAPSVDMIYVCGICNRAFETVREVESHALSH